MHSLRLKHVVVIACALGALLSGTGAVPAHAAPVTTARVLWTHRDYAPVTEPAAVAGRVVVYTASRGVLSLRAVDPVTGRTVWARPATRSYTTTGVYTTVAHSGTTAYYYRPVGPLQYGRATLVAIDVRTGRDKWVQPGSRAYLDMPDVCRTSRPLLCMSAYEDNGVTGLRIDGVTGQVRRIASAGRHIGPELFNPDTRNPERIERRDTVTGRRIWTLDLRTLSPSRRITTDRGWHWDLINGVYVGWVAFDTKESFDGDAFTYDLAKQQTFGIRASDGKVLWRAAGRLDCLNVDLDRPVYYRCVGSGTSTWYASTSELVVGRSDVTLERFDVLTGRATWRSHIGDAPAALRGEPPASAAGHLVTIPLAAGGAATINMVDGQEATLPAADTSSSGGIGWCAQEATWHSTVPLPSSGTASRDFPRFGLVQPCTPDSMPAAATTGMPAGPTVVVAGVLIWSSKDGLHGVRVE